MKKSILIKITILFSIFIQNASSQEITITIPEPSNIHLFSPDEYTSLVSFSGKIELRGTIFLATEKSILDGEEQWKTSLLFFPDGDSRRQLPSVRYKDEPLEKTNSPIQLNPFKPAEQRSAIQSIFGEEAAAKIDKGNTPLSKTGTLVLDSYRTGVECDKRHYYADLVYFERRSEIQQAEAGDLLQNINSTCN